MEQLSLDCAEETRDGEEKTIWYVKKEDDSIAFEVNECLGEDVTECIWLNFPYEYIHASYRIFEGEFSAILSNTGTPIRMGLESVQKYIPEHDLFIVEVSGKSLGDDNWEFNILSEDIRWAVINRDGDFVISPQFADISYIDMVHINSDDSLPYPEEKFSTEYGDKEQVFVASGQTGTLYKIDLNGELIEKKEE